MFSKVRTFGWSHGDTDDGSDQCAIRDEDILGVGELEREGKLFKGVEGTGNDMNTLGLGPECFGPDCGLASACALFLNL